MKQTVEIIFDKVYKGLPLVIVMAILSIAGCTEKSKEANATDHGDKTEDKVVMVSNPVSDGYVLLKANCYACHNPSALSHDDILAPPFSGVKMRYQKATDSRESFIKKVTTFVMNPNENTALMRGAVKRFGVMPKPVIKEEDIQVIAGYIYDNKLEEPAWFEDHHNEMKGN